MKNTKKCPTAKEFLNALFIGEKAIADHEKLEAFASAMEVYALAKVNERLALFNVNKLVTVEYYKAYYGGYTKAVKHHKENDYRQSKYEIGQCFEGWINAPENRPLKR